MPRCADPACGRWRPELRPFDWLTPAGARWFRGLWFNGRMYCSRACVEQAARLGLDEQTPTPAGMAAIRPPRLGALLQHAGVVSDAHLFIALATQVHTGLRLGAQLQRLALVGAEPLLRALAAQGGVSYIGGFDVSRVRRVPAVLPETMVRALGLVPFEADEARRRLRVACAAPVPRLALRALLKLTGWTPEPYLIEDQAWEAALEAYRSPGDAATHQAVRVPGLGDAAARVAEAAAEESAVTMRLAVCDDYLWVRVEGRRRVSDMLVAGGRGVEPPAAA